MLTPSTAPAFVFVLLRVTGTTICRLREDMEEWAAWSGQHLFARLLCDGHDVPTYIVRVEHGKCMGVFVILLGARRRTPPNVSSASLARNGKRRGSAIGIAPAARGGPSLRSPSAKQHVRARCEIEPGLLWRSEPVMDQNCAPSCASLRRYTCEPGEREVGGGALGESHAPHSLEQRTCVGALLWSVM